MGPASYGDLSEISKLERAQVLDSIDVLRRAPFSADIDTPQIVVCGTNSFDKNSLLGALIQLPMSVRVTERYPTEYIMRYDVNSQVHACFRPDPSRVSADILHLQQFKYTLHTADESETSRMFKAASWHHGQLKLAPSYYHDMLRIEVTGPAQLPLTLIDLPTLCATTTNKQGIEDTAIALRMAQLYMYKPSTIVLTPANCLHDLQFSLIRDIVKSELAIHQRTLGVMMKPAWMSETDTQKSYQVVRNDDRELKLGLGWHVTGCSRFTPMPEHEHLRKADIWSALPSTDVGIPSLRKKLSDMLFPSIQRELPRLLNEMTRRIIQKDSYGDEIKTAKLLGGLW